MVSLARLVLQNIALTNAVPCLNDTGSKVLESSQHWHNQASQCLKLTDVSAESSDSTMTFSITTLSIMAFSIMTLNIKGLFVTFSIISITAQTPLCWVASFCLILGWVSLWWMSLWWISLWWVLLCWMSLFWVSWCPSYTVKTKLETKKCFRMFI